MKTITVTKVNKMFDDTQQIYWEYGDSSKSMKSCTEVPSGRLTDEQLKDFPTAKAFLEEYFNDTYFAGLDAILAEDVPAPTIPE